MPIDSPICSVKYIVYVVYILYVDIILEFVKYFTRQLFLIYLFINYRQPRIINRGVT